MSTDRQSAALTERRIRDARPRAEAWTLWDSGIKGFGVRIAGGGTKSYLLMYRAGGRQRRWTFGRVGEMSLADARHVAREEMALIRLGRGDPAGKRQEAAAAPTVGDGLARYFAEYAPARVEAGRLTERTLIDYRGQARRTVAPALGNIKIADVTRADVELAVARIAQVQRSRTLALISMLFNLFETWEYRPQHTNPARGIEKVREEPRDRTLSPSETSALGAALAACGRPLEASTIRFLMLTGWRTGEALGLRWDHVNFETGEIVLPSTKTGRDVRRLAGLALQVVAGMPRIHGDDRVFPVRRDTLRRHFKLACKAADIADCTVHDLRRTFASNAANAGLSVLVLRDLLGHKTLAMANRYARRSGTALYDAQDAGAERMAALLAGKAGVVVPIRNKG